MDLARLLVEIDANTAGAEAGIASLHKQLGIAAIGFGVIGVAAIGAGLLATHMAGDFQAGVKTLVTGAGENIRMVGFWTDKIKDLAVETGTSTKQLVDGAFMINSAGYHGAAGLEVLRAAAEGAKVGNADLGATANAVTTVMTDYAAKNVTAAQATNILLAIVSHGKTHMQDLASSISTVLPAAAKYGVSLGDVSAAVATMTMQNGDAAASTTYLRQLLTSLASPSGAAKKALESVGLSSQQVSDEMKKSLPKTLEMIQDAINKTFKPGSVQANEAFKEIAGGSRQMQGMLLLTGTSLETFKRDAVDMALAAAWGGKHINHWSEIQGDFNLQLSKAREMIETAFITIGEKLLPVLTKVVKFMVDNAVPAVTKLTQFWKDHQGIIIIVAALIAGALGTAFIVWAATAAAAAVATIAATWPILAIGAAIGLLIAALIWAYNNWGWFRQAVQGAAKDAAALGPIIGKLIGWFGDLLGILGHVKDAIGEAFGKAGDLIGKISTIHLPGFASGTSFTPGGAFWGAEQGPELLLTPGMYTAPKGSTVLSARDTAAVLSGGSGGGKQQTVNIYPQKADLDSDDLQRHLRRVALLAGTSGGYA